MRFDKSYKARDEKGLCRLCLRMIAPGHFYVFGDDSRIAHYQCAKKRHWERRRKQKIKPEFAPVTRAVKVIKAQP